MAEGKLQADVVQPQQAQDREKPAGDPVPDLTIASAEDEYLHGLPLTLMTLALMAGIFMIALDNSIIYTTSLSHSFHLEQVVTDALASQQRQSQR